MITFAEARDRVKDATEGEWDGPGTHHVALEGSEDGSAYLVTVGAEEWLVDRDPDYAVLGDPQYLVDKATGAITQAVNVADERLDDMTPIRLRTA
jgi:hypothetical protein